MDTRKLNPLRRAAKDLGIIQAGDRDVGHLPTQDYLEIYEALRKPIRPIESSRFGGLDAATYIGRSLLTRSPISALTYICVSDYVGGTRYKLQNGNYRLTLAERAMLGQASAIGKICQQRGYQFQWRLMLADGWGKDLYGNRVVPGALDAYCSFMETECIERGFEAIRWSTLMGCHHHIYQQSRAEIHHRALELAPWEAEKGEIAHDKPGEEQALSLAYEHICMRAAEGRVAIAAFGDSVVLSTEVAGLTRYDNLLVSGRRYPLLFSMPFWPHRLTAAELNGQAKEIDLIHA